MGEYPPQRHAPKAVVQQLQLRGLSQFMREAEGSFAFRWASDMAFARGKRNLN